MPSVGHSRPGAGSTPRRVIPARPKRWRGVRGAVLGMVLTGLGILVGASTAQAHDVLIRTDPVAGSVVSPPSRVELTFDQQALKIGTRVQVSGPGGTVVVAGPVQVVGSYVTQPLPAGLASGAYRVLWRVTSADGHPVSGAFGFTVTGGITAGAKTTSSAGAAGGSSNSGKATSGLGRGAVVAIVVVFIVAAGVAATMVMMLAGRDARASSVSSTVPLPERQ